MVLWSLQCVDRLSTALLYVTPAHQYPTGHTLSVDRRHAIVAWARRYGCYILEDDRDGDLRYEGSPLQAISATAQPLRVDWHGSVGGSCPGPDRPRR
jgi:DNA-binding transcriptional MocR family regulator